MRPLHLRRVVAVVATLAIAGSSAAIVSAAGVGASKGKSAAAVQYLTKPGCGPDKTDGVAGNSGRHTGQPPKKPDRQDCPNPPGQQTTTVQAQSTPAKTPSTPAQSQKKK